MHKRSRFRPFLENLEDRCCPSFTTSFSGGTLTLTGAPTATASQALYIQRTGAGTNYLVKDQAATNGTGGITIGTFAITRDLHLNLTHYVSAITINLEGGTFPGSIYLSLGQGDVTASPPPLTILGGNTPAMSQVNGSVYVTGGSGQENVIIGQGVADPTSPTLTEVMVGGIVSFSGNPAINASGNALSIGPGSVVGTGVSATQVTTVNVGSSVQPAGLVSGYLTVNDTSSPNGSTVDILGTVAGNVTYNGSTLSANHLFLSNDSGMGGGTGSVGGSVNASLGVGSGAFDKIVLDPGTSIGSNLSVYGGNGGESTDLEGSVGGSATFNFGNGAYSISSASTFTVGQALNVTVGNNSSGFNAVDLLGTIGGAATFNMGNGQNTIDDMAVIGGSLVITMGNGTNMFTLDDGSQVLGSTLRYTGGTGPMDTVILQNGQANTFALDVIFKGGNRELEFNPDPITTVDTTVASAYIDFGTGPGTKSLIVNNASMMFTNSETLLNYP